MPQIKDKPCLRQSARGRVNAHDAATTPHHRHLATRCPTLGRVPLMLDTGDTTAHTARTAPRTRHFNRLAQCPLACASIAICGSCFQLSAWSVLRPIPIANGVRRGCSLLETTWTHESSSTPCTYPAGVQTPSRFFLASTWCSRTSRSSSAPPRTNVRRSRSTGAACRSD